MKQFIEGIFSSDSSCLEEHQDAYFGVLDPPGNSKCVVIKNPDEKVHFKVFNPHNKLIGFLAIDHCLLTSADPRRCDFAVFDEKTFCFIEAKETTRKQQKAKHRRQAKMQLLETIEWFQSKIDFTGKTLEAHLCVGNENPRPKSLSSDAAAVLKFAELGVALYDDNQQTFE